MNAALSILSLAVAIVTLVLTIIEYRRWKKARKVGRECNI
jgi:hypothetical protein